MNNRGAVPILLIVILVVAAAAIISVVHEGRIPIGVAEKR